MAAKLQSLDAAKAANTVPLVESDGAGGHVPYVREDTTPTDQYPAADAQVISLLRELLEVMADIRDECRATRLGLQEWVNEGNQGQQYDFLEMSQQVRDASEEA